ncbi:hypothetical protein CGCF415_v011870 [Colletotrichum fructicola]|uniref:Uncharacterized protein n=2 Tax=Colletotrichum gloeosporioides species complex TaxID=2707338 RepID=T0JWF8_COLGC|nr:uncharacterized protein CGCA056_v012964 [Colletotrichum aenigma]EQB47317.1 hypothetical protein CGLO_13558 [Colletotrichum gloeosporioides Cg-14]KAF4474726.1 hypothetical protein CGGC5_v015754 [Colletotrichum fructicola Nara gc5]KAF4887358.1 hypothetical protein CGCFRS4_v010567 [Colletotrichum fructicola]KAF4895614.1 hypothetical protein CGCF415_v011870 [Colletotrichum fructicola]KAF4929527.1 hypothetical protein CGCF245_v012081 [Colletotrichum fructicola]
MGPLKRKVSDGGGGVEPRDWKKTQYSCREEPDKVAVWAWVLQLREQTMGEPPRMGPITVFDIASPHGGPTV